MGCYLAWLIEFFFGIDQLQSQSQVPSLDSFGYLDPLLSEPDHRPGEVPLHLHSEVLHHHLGAWVAVKVVLVQGAVYSPALQSLYMRFSPHEG